MKKILIAICITILVIFILLIAILKTNKSEVNNVKNTKIETNSISNNSVTEEIVDYTIQETNQKIEEIVLNEATHITEANEYFTVKSIVEKYVELMGNNEKSSLIKLLSQTYIEEFNVNENNIKYNIPERENYTQTSKPTPTNMRKTQNSKSPESINHRPVTRSESSHTRRKDL